MSSTKRSEGPGSPTLLVFIDQKIRFIVTGVVVFFAFLFVVTLALGAAVFDYQHTRAMEQWMQINKAAVAEALYLHNAQAVDLRLQEFRERSDRLVHYEISLNESDLPPGAAARRAVKTSPFQAVLVERLAYAGQVPGVVRLTAKPTALALIAGLALLLLVFWGLLLGFKNLLGRAYDGIREGVIRPLEQLKNLLGSRLEAPKFAAPAGPDVPVEITDLFQGYQSLLSRIQDYSQREVDAARAKALMEIARQVAHDIRSPLAALEMTVKSSEELPEDRRLLVRGSIARIRDIANNLLKNNANVAGDTDAVGALGRPELLSTQIESLVSQKRLEFRSHLGLHIEFEQNSESCGVFSDIHAGEFHRVISNLINNSVEAMPERRGSVHVTLSEDATHAIVGVRDTGIGMSADVLARLGEKGFSLGKKTSESGSGLGLFHAKQKVQQWGGELRFESAPGAGTTVRVRLPRSAPPAWFPQRLVLRENSDVVVVDDDPAIHGVWKERLAGVPHGRTLTLHHLSTPEDLRTFYRRLAPRDLASKKFVFLVDYELIGFRENGLDLIEELRLADSALLVTSRFEEAGLEERCTQLDMKLLPKGLVPYLPIVVDRKL